MLTDACLCLPRLPVCRTSAFPMPRACPVPLSFITAVNVAAVWLAGPLSALLAARWPVIGLSFFAIPAINLFAHAGPAVLSGHYNPGLLTALVLFLPLWLWRLRASPSRAIGSACASIIATIVRGHGPARDPDGSPWLRSSTDAIGLDLLLLQIANPFLSALIVVCSPADRQASLARLRGR